jgi:hypothetical protein
MIFPPTSSRTWLVVAPFLISLMVPSITLRALSFIETPVSDELSQPRSKMPNFSDRMMM